MCFGKVPIKIVSDAVKRIILTPNLFMVKLGDLKRRYKMMIDARKAEVKKIKTIEPPVANSQGLALSLYGPGGSLTSEGKMYGWRYVLAVTIFTILAALTYQTVFAYTASYYTYESCVREGTSGVWTASGERFDENDLTCAMRRRDWGTMIKVTNLANGKSVIVRLNDFGPNKKLHDQGRIIDLSKGAFEKIASLKQGVINVKVEVLK